MFFNNYLKPGKGVEPRDPNEPRWKVFFDVFHRKFWDLFKLNILYILIAAPFFVATMIIAGVVSVPIINVAFETSGKEIFLKYDLLVRMAFSFLFMVFLGLGPATASYTYIMREHANEKPCMLISDFFERFKLNFKQGISMWLIDLVALYVFTIAMNFYGKVGMVFLQYILWLIAIIYVMMHIYIYQMMITFDLSLKHILRNSFLLAMGKVPSNLLILVCNFVLYAVIPIWALVSLGNITVMLIILLLEIFILPPITGFITNFCVIPILKKYIKEDIK